MSEPTFKDADGVEWPLTITVRDRILKLYFLDRQTGSMYDPTGSESDHQHLCTPHVLEWLDVVYTE